MKFKTLLPIFALALSFGVHAKKCSSLEGCVKLASELTGDQYLHTTELKGDLRTSGNFNITKDNATKLLSTILHLNGYTRIPIHGQKNMYKVINARDVRFHSTPKYKASKIKDGKVPMLNDYFMMEYKLSHPAQGTNMTRSVRPFLSRYGRIIENKDTGLLIVQDTGENINRLYEIFKSMDKKPSKESLSEARLRRKRQHELRLAEASACKDKKKMEFPKSIRNKKKK